MDWDTHLAREVEDFYGETLEDYLIENGHVAAAITKIFEKGDAKYADDIAEAIDLTLLDDEDKHGHAFFAEATLCTAVGFRALESALEHLTGYELEAMQTVYRRVKDIRATALERLQSTIDDKVVRDLVDKHERAEAEAGV